MTRTFEGKNFYEILDLPLGAGTADINRAYTEALEMYDENALATYALFSEAQQKEILNAIEEAFRTLSNKKKRTNYNKILIAAGDVDAASFPDHPGDTAPGEWKNSLSSGSGAHIDPMVRDSEEEKIRELVDAVSRKEIVSGEDLKQIREARGIDLSEIYQRTRISRDTLEKIERNQYGDLPAEIFLKSFLRAYAEILEIDPKNIVSGYLTAMKMAE